MQNTVRAESVILTGLSLCRFTYLSEQASKNVAGKSVLFVFKPTCEYMLTLNPNFSLNLASFGHT